jgi:hypothetical protein
LILKCMAAQPILRQSMAATDPEVTSEVF